MIYSTNLCVCIFYPFTTELKSPPSLFPFVPHPLVIIERTILFVFQTDPDLTQTFAPFACLSVACLPIIRTETQNCDPQPGLMCPNAACGAYYWGAGSEAGCVSTLYQRLTLAVRGHLKVYYQTYLRCDDRWVLLCWRMVVLVPLLLLLLPFFVAAVCHCCCFCF